jgi:hypothetical protein
VLAALAVVAVDIQMPSPLAVQETPQALAHPKETTVVVTVLN